MSSTKIASTDSTSGASATSAASHSFLRPVPDGGGKSARPSSRSWPLAIRLTALFGASSLVILSTAVLLLYLILARGLHRDHDQFLNDKIRVLRTLLRERPENQSDLKEEVEETWAPRQYAQFRARILSADGSVMVESPTMANRLPPPLFPAPARPDDLPHVGADIFSTQSAPFRAMSAEAYVGKTNPTMATIEVALDVTPDQHLLRDYRNALLLVLIGAMTVCVASALLVARRGLRPLYQIAETARRVGPTRLDERVRIEGLPPEVSAVAETLNAMLERLSEAFGRLSRFSADIAHELRTPVNNLRVELEVALNRDRTPTEYRETVGSALEESARLARIIDSLLFIARAEDPRTQIRRERLEVAGELSRVCDFYEPPASDAGVTLEIQCAAHTFAELDRTLFQRALANLISNAIDHTASGGRVIVSGSIRDRALCVDVADTGAGIRPEDLPRVFDRFFRADSARSAPIVPTDNEHRRIPGAAHAGLGLAIVKTITTLHNGTIDVRSAPGQGTCITLRFPLPDRPATQAALPAR